MQAFHPHLVTALSRPRLHVYETAASSAAGLRAPRSNLDLVGAYAHNILVAKDLLPTLHLLEVTLRNSLSAALCKVLKRPDWYDTPGLLGPIQQQQLHQTKSKLGIKRKPLSPDYVVAESTFGFWVGLFGSYYERSLWQRHKTLIIETFPHSPRHSRTRRQLGHLLNPLRDLRNNVMHWERVTDEPHLATRQQDATRLIAWMSPAAAVLLSGLCEFDRALGHPGQEKARHAAGHGFLFDEIRSL